ncbi:hypothetical protein [Bacillus sp. SD088]|nr:hypothetical protein [Bacillus sp. SD088]
MPDQVLTLDVGSSRFDHLENQKAKGLAAKVQKQHDEFTKALSK